MGRGRGRRYTRFTGFNNEFDDPIEEVVEIFSLQEDGITPTNIDDVLIATFDEGFPRITYSIIGLEPSLFIEDSDFDISNGFQLFGTEIDIDRALNDLDYILEENLIGQASLEDFFDSPNDSFTDISSEDLSLDSALPDSASTESGQSITIDVLENDVEVGDDGFEFSSGLTSSQGGIVEQVDGQLLFTPGEDFVGTDSFTYDLLSQDGEATVIDTATVTVEVTEPINQPAPESPRASLEAVFGTLDGDIVEVQGSNQLIFTGDSDDLVDAFTGDGSNRINAGSGNDTLILRENDRFFGGDGSDRFFATSGGNNTLTGGEGADQFWIATAEFPNATNTVTDFTIGEDVIGIAGLGIGFEQVNLTQNGDDTLISTNGNDLAVLEGIDNTNLSESDFTFA